MWQFSCSFSAKILTPKIDRSVDSHALTAYKNEVSQAPAADKGGFHIFVSSNALSSSPVLLQLRLFANLDCLSARPLV